MKNESPSTGGGSKAFSLRQQLPEDIPLFVVHLAGGGGGLMKIMVSNGRR